MLTILTLLLAVVCGLGTGQIAYGQGSPLVSVEEALAASAACLTYGMIANLDVDEPTIPNPMFTAALQMGERVSRYLAHTRPCSGTAGIWP